MIEDLQRRAQEWQKKRERVKRVLVISALTVLAVLVSVLWNEWNGIAIRWWGAAAVAAVALGTLLISLSVYTNTTLVSMYYQACYHFLSASDELEMVTGTIERAERLKLPYIGMLYQVTLVVAGERLHFYCPGRLLRGLRAQERIRVQLHDQFVVRVEPTGLVDLDSSTKTA